MTKGRCNFLKEWNDWDLEVHEDPAQIDRQGRAMTYPFTFRIFKRKMMGRFSSTTDLPYYDTSLTECTCYDFQGRKLPCKHIYRLAVELGYIEIINRPTFDKAKVEAIKNSDDIDSEPDQVKRQKSAMTSKCAPVSVDYAARTGVFAGSGKEPYQTTETTCTCRDYFVRRLPCKHIYRLRHELNNAAE